MSLTGEDKDDEATEYGYPGWYTVNFNSSFKIKDEITLQLAIENITDNFYHSRIVSNRQPLILIGA